MASRYGTMRQRCGAREGFTLVELLVIISIILLLISILVPASERMQEVAKRVKCLAHLKEQYKAAMLYANAHKRQLCPLKCTIEGKRWRYDDVLSEYISNPQMYHCPAQKAANLHISNRLDFGINHYGYDRSHPDYVAKRYLGTLHRQWLNKIGDMSCTYLADADSDRSPEDIGGISRSEGVMEWPIRWSFENWAYKRHLGGYNAVRLNGEAEFFPNAWEIPYNEEWFIKKY